MRQSKTALDGGRAAMRRRELRDHHSGPNAPPSAGTFLPREVRRLLMQAQSSWWALSRSLGFAPDAVAPAEQASLRQRLCRLSLREREVLGVYLGCLQVKRTARQLGICPQTVRNHLASVQQKLGAYGREAIVLTVLASLDLLGTVRNVRGGPKAKSSERSSSVPQR
jgi:DNA-binding NarL/FixJ family response regulator